MLDMSTVGLPLFLQSLACPELPLVSSGLGRFDSLLPAAGFVHFGSLISIRSFLRPDPTASSIGTCDFGGVVFVLDYTSLGPSTLIQSFAYFGLSLLSFGISRFDLSILVIGLSLIGLPLFLRSSSRLESSPLMCSLTHLSLTALAPDLLLLGAPAPWLHMHLVYCK